MMNIKNLITLCVITLLTASAGHAQDTETNSTPISSIGKWRINLSGGYGYRMGNTDDQKDSYIDMGFNESDVDAYFKDIKSGYKLAGQVHYMFWDNMGLGIDYNFFHTSASLSGYINSPDIYEYTTLVKIEDDFFTNYIGASIYTENPLGQSQFKLYSQLSLGLSLYREEVLFSYTPLVATGNNLGVNFELGLEYEIAKNVSLGLGISYFASTISKIKFDDGQSTHTMELSDEERESLSRLDMTMGFSFYF